MIFVHAILLFVALLTLLALGLTVAQRVLVDYGRCHVDINEGEKPLEVDGGQSLLEALYANEVYIPSACGGKGTCGHCKLTVLAGGGPVLPTETPYLTRRERRSGVRLACQVKVREDLALRVPEEYLNVRMFQARVARVRELTHDIREIRLTLEDPAEIEHRPGQYVQVQAPSPEGPVFRAYSISSPPHERNLVELVVRLVPGGVGSTYLHSLTEGDPVVFTGPYGDFRLNEDPNTEVVCVGGGCGMAPMRSIIRSIYHRWPERTCRLFFGARTPRDVFYLEDFRELAEQHPSFHVVYALSDELSPAEQQTWIGETGFIHLAVDEHLDPDVPRQAFLCGPPPMIEAVTEVLHEKGLPDENIFYDEF